MNPDAQWLYPVSTDDVDNEILQLVIVFSNWHKPLLPNPGLAVVVAGRYCLDRTISSRTHVRYAGVDASDTRLMRASGDIVKVGQPRDDKISYRTIQRWDPVAADHVANSAEESVQEIVDRLEDAGVEPGVGTIELGADVADQGWHPLEKYDVRKLKNYRFQYVKLMN